MTETNAALLAGLPPNVQALLARPPLDDTRLLAEAAAGFPGRPDDFGSALAENRDQEGRFPAWPVTLIRDLVLRRQHRSRPPRSQRKGRR